MRFAGSSDLNKVSFSKLREGVQFAHMKLLREEDGLYSGALQIVGKCVEFAMSVGNVPLSDGGDYHASTLDPNLQPTKRAGNAFSES